MSKCIHVTLLGISWSHS